MALDPSKFAHTIHEFMQSPKWTNEPPIGYAKSTRELWGRELRMAQREDLLGGVAKRDIRPSLVDSYLDGLSSKPGKQAAAYAALKQLDKWAAKKDKLQRSITFGIEVEGTDGGHVPWADEHVALVERAARPDIALAVTLASNTGQRGSDLVRVAANDVEEYERRLGVNVRQEKTGKVVWVPFTAPMVSAWQTWPWKVGPLLRKLNGDAWTRKALTNAWSYERDQNPALAPLADVELASTSDKGLVLHGLRGTACVRLSRAGCTTRQIADMVGMSEEMVVHYCRFSSQRENALAAVTILDRTTRERLRGTK